MSTWIQEYEEGNPTAAFDCCGGLQLSRMSICLPQIRYSDTLHQAERTSCVNLVQPFILQHSEKRFSCHHPPPFLLSVLLSSNGPEHLLPLNPFNLPPLHKTEVKSILGRQFFLSFPIHPPIHCVGDSTDDSQGKAQGCGCVLLFNGGGEEDQLCIC